MLTNCLIICANLCLLAQGLHLLQKNPPVIPGQGKWSTSRTYSFTEDAAKVKDQSRGILSDVVFHDTSYLYRQGVLPYEIITRTCGLMMLWHAWQHGYGPWILLTFMVGIPFEMWWTHKGWICKADSWLMNDACSEAGGLHASFWMFWFYPHVLAMHRIRLPLLIRALATALLVTIMGTPFDFLAPINGWWYFRTIMETTFLHTTAPMPGAASQHFIAGFVSSLVFELSAKFGSEQTTVDAIYPKITTWVQILVLCPAVLVMFPLVQLFSGTVEFLGVMGVALLIVAGQVFRCGISLEQGAHKDWIPLLVPITFLSFTIFTAFLSYLDIFKVAPHTGRNIDDFLNENHLEGTFTLTVAKETDLLMIILCMLSVVLGGVVLYTAFVGAVLEGDCSKKGLIVGQ